MVDGADRKLTAVHHINTARAWGYVGMEGAVVEVKHSRKRQRSELDGPCLGNEAMLKLLAIFPGGPPLSSKEIEFSLLSKPPAPGKPRKQHRILKCATSKVDVRMNC